MTENTQVNLRVSEAQKASWEEYIEEDGRFQSISELIRTSVEAEISKDSDEVEGGRSPAFENDIQDLKDELSEIRKDVDWLRGQEQEDVDISELAQEVYETLEVLPKPTDSIQIPEDEDETEYRRKRAAEMVVLPKVDEDSPSPQTASAIADRLDTKPKRVHDAIEHLNDQFLPVVEVELAGNDAGLDRGVHYFREE